MKKILTNKYLLTAVVVMSVVASAVAKFPWK
jgi:hypothetical protein